MRTRLLYTLVFIFCLSAFASPKNECAYPLRDSSPCDKSNTGNSRVLPSKEVSKDLSEDGQEFSTFQFAKFLYI